MNELKRRELELLAKICNEYDIPFKLARKLVSTAQKLSYENVPEKARIREYQEWIDAFNKKE